MAVFGKVSRIIRTASVGVMADGEILDREEELLLLQWSGFGTCGDFVRRYELPKGSAFAGVGIDRATVVCSGVGEIEIAFFIKATARGAQWGVEIEQLLHLVFTAILRDSPDLATTPIGAEVGAFEAGVGFAAADADVDDAVALIDVAVFGHR